LKTIKFLTLVLLSNIVSGQDTNQVEREILNSLICNYSIMHEECIYYVNFSNIDKFEFYQDTTSFNESYRYIEKNIPNSTPWGGHIVDASTTHHIAINYYDRIPFQEVSKLTSLDTTEINRFLTTINDIQKNSDFRTKTVYKCNDSQYRKQLNMRIFKRLMKYSCLFYSNPIIFNNKYVLIKITKFGTSLKNEDYIPTIYLMEKINNKWTVKDYYSVIKTRNLDLIMPYLEHKNK